MKNFSVFLNFILTLAVMILFYLHFSEKRPPSPGPDKENSISSIPKIINDSGFGSTAFLNTDTLFEKFLYVKEMRDDLAAERLKSENSYHMELKKLEKEVYDFQEKASSMTQQEGETKQMELAEKEQKLMKLEHDLSAKLADIELEKNKLIQKVVAEYLEKINKEKNYAYIFGYNGMGNVLYANPQNDITNEIIDGLNEEFKVKSEVKKK